MITATTLYLILLTNFNLQPTEAATMTCIAIAESNLDNKAVHYNESNDTFDYGLFQINGVHIGTLVQSSNDLMRTNQNIRVAVKIYKRDGFTAWATYKKCRGRNA